MNRRKKKSKTRNQCRKDKAFRRRESESISRARRSGDEIESSKGAKYKIE